MSQKVRVLRVDVRGASPYLGKRATGEVDADGEPVQRDEWSRNGDRVMDWLCDAHRFRFNQCRSRRTKAVPVVDEATGETEWVQVPLGKSVDTQSEKEARAAHSFLASVPYAVVNHPNKAESKDWFAGLKRRKTLRSKGADVGSLPGFRKRGRDHQRLGAYYNNGKGFAYRQTSAKRAMVVLRGQNAKENVRPGETGQRFEVRVHVRLSQPIREFTSVEVDWTTKTLVFVNEPAPLKGVQQTGAVVGLDAGVVHTLTTSDGAHLDLPLQRLEALHAKVKRHSKRMAKSREVAKEQGRRFWESKRYQRHRAAAAEAHAAAARVREDWWHKATTALVRDHDVMAVEDLNLKAMTKRARLVNVAQKSGLNRALLRAGLGDGRGMLEYKARVNGKRVLPVRAAYSSQECSECGHTAQGNRKSQALFSCQVCARTSNADLNAARVLLKRGLALLEQEELSSGADVSRAGSKGKTGAAPAAVPAPAGNREPVLV